MKFWSKRNGKKNEVGKNIPNKSGVKPMVSCEEHDYREKSSDAVLLDNEKYEIVSKYDGSEKYENEEKNNKVNKRSTNAQKTDVMNSPGTTLEGKMDKGARNTTWWTDTSVRPNDDQSSYLYLRNEMRGPGGEVRGSENSYNNYKGTLLDTTDDSNTRALSCPFDTSMALQTYSDAVRKIFLSRSLEDHRYNWGQYPSPNNIHNGVHCWGMESTQESINTPKDQIEPKTENGTESIYNCSTKDIVQEQNYVKTEESSGHMSPCEFVFESFLDIGAPLEMKSSTVSDARSIAEFDITSFAGAVDCEEFSCVSDWMDSWPPSAVKGNSTSSSLEAQRLIEFAETIQCQRKEGIQGIPSLGAAVKPDSTTEEKNKPKPEVKSGTDGKSRELEVPKKETETATEDMIQLDNRIHSLVAVSDKADSKVTLKESEKKVSVKGSDGKNVDYEADEVLRLSKVTTENSTLLKELLQQVEASHNVAVFLASAKTDQTACLGVAQNFLKSVMASLAKAEEKNGLKYEAHMTAVAMPSHDSARDLFAGAFARPKPLRFGSNPLYGVCLMNLEEKPVKGEMDAEKLLQDAMKRSTDTKETVLVHMVLKQIKKSTGDKVDVCLSAILMVFVRENGDYLAALSNKDEKVVPVPLFRDVIGGGSRSLVVTAISGSDAATEAKILGNAEKLRSVQNTAPRSGNVARFMRYASEEVERLESKEKISSREKSILNTLRSMLLDLEGIDSDIKKKPLAYPVRSIRNPDNQENRVVDKGVVGMEDVSEDPLVSLEKKYLNRVVLVENSGVEVTSATLTLRSGKLHKVEECIYCKDAVNDDVHSSVLSRLEEIFAGGNNVAILGANISPGATPQKQLLWKSMKDILSSVLDDSLPVKNNTVTLRMCVVKGNTVLRDLLGQGSEMPLSPLVSPIFGPVVDGIVAKKLKNSTEANHIINKALRRASKWVEEGAVILATAVLKQILNKDVRLASLFVAGAQNLDAFYDKTENNSNQPLTIFDASFNSSCITTAVLTYDYATSQEGIVEASLNRIESLAVVKKPLLIPGSVRTFTNYAKSALSSRYNVGGNALKHLELALADHERMLIDPLEEDPVAYPPEQLKYGKMKVTTVAIFRKKRESLSNGDILGSLASVSETSSVKVEDISHNVDEFLTFSKDVTTIRSEQLQIAESVFARGGNAAVLLAGMQGSTVSSLIIRHVTHNVLVDTSSVNNLRMSIVALKSDGTAKDFLQEGSTYEGYTVNIFPLVGPLLNGAKLVVPPSDAVILEKQVRNVYLECLAEKALLVVILLKYSSHESEKFRSLRSSFLFALAGDDLEPYSMALARKPHGLDMFQYALGGPCRTVAIFGLTKIDGEVASEFMNLLCRLRSVVNPVIAEDGIRSYE
ncbi:hypothetical protein LSM04_002858 [Trypanosoma melophagium]|uniref:uncharacterized protein n=1 Tax=Trypanosoma melophagium TaxID=715481 RepID=UPI003519DB9B|nr:hypothetical protein LSM04_002858 [Trypanosoma melophagium]